MHTKDGLQQAANLTQLRSNWDNVAWIVPSCTAQYRVSLNPVLRQALCAKFARMCELFLHTPHKLGEHFDRIAYLGHEPYELDITGKWRGIVQIQDRRLVLLRVGDHDMIPHQTFTPYDYHRASSEVAVPFAQTVLESELRATGNVRTTLSAALDSRWFYTLSPHQASIVDALASNLEEQLRPQDPVLVTGGPGTGKTIVLVQLAMLLDWDPARVVFTMSDPVAAYLSSGIGDHVKRCRGLPEDLHGNQVLLIDDPVSWAEVEAGFAIAETACAKAVVVSTDLAQVDNVVSDSAIKRFLGSRRIVHHHLRECYRQSAKVGETSVAFLRHISTRFTKHINPEKVSAFARNHTLSVESANDMVFVSPGGSSRVLAQATAESVLLELRRLRRSQLWQYWRPVCVVLEEGLRLDRAVLKEIRDLSGEVISLGETPSIRGVEYQHVLVIVSRALLQEMMVTGRRGLTTQAYIEARNMRIPFSRATDSLVICGVN